MGKHWVPQEYLRGFSPPDREERVWMFDKSVGEWSNEPLPISKVAQRRDFYPDEVENELTGRVEAPANLVLKKLRGTPNILIRDLSNEDRFDLARYMATMMYRVPKKRELGHRSIPTVLDSVIDDFREEIRVDSWRRGVHPCESQPLHEEAERLRGHFRENPPEELLEQIKSPWPCKEVIAAIYAMTWYLVRSSDTARFVTSDNPFFHFSCYGVASEESEFSFPLSSGLGLFGTWTPASEKRRFRPSTSLVKESNRRLISEASRFVFADKRYSWVGRVAEKQEPYLSRIVLGESS